MWKSLTNISRKKSPICGKFKILPSMAKYCQILPVWQNIANVAKLIHFSILGIRFAKGKKGELLQCFLGRNLLSLLSPIHAWSVHAGFLTHKHTNGTFRDVTMEPKLSKRVISLLVKLLSESTISFRLNMLFTGSNNILWN